MLANRLVLCLEKEHYCICLSLYVLHVMDTHVLTSDTWINSVSSVIVVRIVLCSLYYYCSLQWVLLLFFNDEQTQANDAIPDRHKDRPSNTVLELPFDTMMN